MRALKALRRELIEPKTVEYHGRVVKLMGDGTLMEFGSVVDAVNFATDVQRAMAERSAKVPEDRRIIYRMGRPYLAIRMGGRKKGRGNLPSTPE